jgi:hypothetical protein
LFYETGWHHSVRWITSRLNRHLGSQTSAGIGCVFAAVHVGVTA